MTAPDLTMWERITAIRAAHDREVAAQAREDTLKEAANHKAGDTP